MSSSSETGHAINVAHFHDLITFVQGYGSAYNPSNNAITLTALQSLATQATAALNTVHTATSAHNAAVAAREVAFEPLSKRTTRITNILKASGVSEQVFDQVFAVARKVKGVRASAIVKADDSPESTPTEPETKQVSTSQMSYDSRAENFNKLILLLAGIPEYNPNEPELTIATLTALDADLKAKNSAVISAEVPLSNARIARNNLLYTDSTGLCPIALTVKNYVKAIFGASSPQYKQISKLKFTDKR